MKLLGIDTSGREGTLALRVDGQPVGEKSLSQTGRRHAQTLVAEIDALLVESGLEYSELNAVAVSIGPGSFTGLRVGVACAKTLAWATGCQIVAVDTLQVIAQNSPADVANVWVISDAQRGDLFVGQYARGNNGLFTRTGNIEIAPAQSWCRERPSGSVVTGPGLLKYGGEFTKSVRQLDSNCWQPRAANVCLLGEQQFAKDNTADMWTLEPLYIRRSAAEEKRDGNAQSDKIL
jgi:tRNA threonylcarbamoyladenosine biosynthesis protein TsaB